MGTLKNLSDEALDVALLRRTVGPAGSPDDTVEVDDALLDNPALVWPASIWEVNGGTHEHDPNSPENLAKAEAQRQAEQEVAEKAAQDAANQPAEPEPPLTADPAADPTGGAHAADDDDPASAADTTEN